MLTRSALLRSMTTLALRRAMLGSSTTTTRVPLSASAFLHTMPGPSAQQPTTTNNKNIAKFFLQHDIDYGIANPVHLERIQRIRSRSNQNKVNITNKQNDNDDNDDPIGHAKRVLEHFNDEFELHGYMDAHTLLVNHHNYNYPK